jgi:hypothetical protein
MGRIALQMRQGKISSLSEKELIMCLAVKCVPVERQIANSSIDRDIRDFLAGKTDGEIALHALYDHILDEPVPLRLRAVLKG